MPVVPTTAYSQAEDALNLARALVNDTAGAVFTDTLLMPLLNSAYRGLQRELAENGVSVLAENQERLSNHFAGRTVEGLRIPFTTRNGIPLLEGAVAYFVMRVIDVHPAGDHTLYVGEVEHFEGRDDKPLLFYAGRYQQLGAEKIMPTSWPQDEFSLFSIGSIDPPIT